MKTIEEVMNAFEVAALNAGLLRDGVDVRVIQEQMGHTSLETTEIYLHTSGDKAVRSPLDTAQNIIPLRRSA